MRSLVLSLGLLGCAGALRAQAPGHWPPDSLINTKVFPHNTPVMQVVGAMRNITGALGVRCQFCHVGEEGMPLERFDFAKDEKRTKLVARQMMLMVQEINRRLDTLPEHDHDHDHMVAKVEVTCATCHRGVSRPVPLFTLIQQIDSAAGLDSAVRAYRALRTRHYGRDAYDFGESSLNIAAFRLGRANKVDDALALLGLNEEMFPGSSGMYVVLGNILLMKNDTVGAVAAFREAVKRDTTNQEAKRRLRALGKRP